MTVILETTRNVLITDTAGIPNVIVTPVSGTPTVIVSPSGSPGPPGLGIRVLGTLAEGTSPDQFPISPAPVQGDAWSVNGEELWVSNGSEWILVFSIPPTEELTYLEHQHAVGLYVLTPEESDEFVPVGGIIIRRTQ